MITLKEFKKGGVYYYSDFYDKDWMIIKGIKITKRKGNDFWFLAEIVENHTDREWNNPGTIHSFSNSFIYKTWDELVGDIERSKQSQIQFLTLLLKAIKAKEAKGKRGRKGK